MRYHNITKDDMLNGDGLRVVFWVAGCTHQCENCQNPATWDVHGGVEFDDAAKQELFAELEKSYISGITLSGGDPLHPANCGEISRLIDEIREKFPDKTIWMYTGFRWDEVNTLDAVKKIDVLVDDRYIDSQRDTKLKWRGSANQHVIDVAKSLEKGEIVLHCK